DAAADLVDVLTLLDGAAGDEALLGGALPDVPVEGERLAGLDDHAVHQVREAVDVGHAALTARVLGGERRDLLRDLQFGRFLGGPVGLDDVALELRAARAAAGRRLAAGELVDLLHRLVEVDLEP